ncbi:MAG: hypothetical protein A2006_04540 [Ignavibacteria bacterium GWC2_35_8]|nr:MAG: hypothetical protein A2006_04540 [Ignavibacteria bacterium GWC2_35_8]
MRFLTFNPANTLQKFFQLLLFISIYSVLIFPQKLNIKSLRVYSDSETSFPILTPLEEHNKKLGIEFDIDSDVLPNMNIIFRYCDNNWIPYDNIFLANYGKNIEYDLDFEILPFTCEDARYHYKGFFPNENEFVDFPFSGKWMFYITDVQDTTKVYGSGKFYVVYNEVKMDVNFKKEMLEEKSYSPLEIGRIINLTLSFNLPEELYPNFVDHVEIVQNKRISSPIIVDRTFNTNTRQYSWDADRRFTFTARDIYPGNEYRQTDIRDINKFNSKDVNAQFSGFEISRFFKLGRRDLNGSYLLTNYKNDFATYLNVNFRIKPPEEFLEDIFLVGSFNNWQLGEQYKLEKNGGVFAKTIQLKRGIYDYQFVTGYMDNGLIKDENWIYLEGNFWETSNEYHIFLYYKDPNYGGYDRIIGFKKVLSR